MDNVIYRSLASINRSQSYIEHKHKHGVKARYHESML